jgi:hypothetical protein
MQNRLNRLIALASGLMLASGCSGDNPASPAASIPGIGTVPLNSAISADIAATSGNAIASDLEALIADGAAIGSVAGSASLTYASLEGQGSGSTPSTPEQPNCIAGSQPGVFYCTREPGPGDHLKCTYSEEKKLYVCVKDAESPTKGEDKPASPATGAEACSFDAASLTHTCTRSAEGRTVVKSYQFLDAFGKPSASFVKGSTESIHFVVKTDASEARENYNSVTHSLRDQTASGFLGPNRIWNGTGSSADTNSHREDLSTRRYTGTAADSVKAVTFVDERAAHPYPLSGVVIRVVDYTVLATGKQVETTTVHKRVVVTFNGTADVPISLGDYACVLHLDTHKVDGCR